MKTIVFTPPEPRKLCVRVECWLRGQQYITDGGVKRDLLGFYLESNGVDMTRSDLMILSEDGGFNSFSTYEIPDDIAMKFPELFEYPDALPSDKTESDFCQKLFEINDVTVSEADSWSQLEEFCAFIGLPLSKTVSISARRFA